MCQQKVFPCIGIIFLVLCLPFTNLLFGQDIEQVKLSQQRPKLYEIEKELLSLINTERKKRNLTILISSPELTQLAREHSQDMAAQKKLSHTSSSGKTLRIRYRQAGIYFAEGGENIAFSETFRPDFIHQSLMESPKHRNNILAPEFNKVGIGVIYKEAHGYYVTQDFTYSPEVLSSTEAQKLLHEKINALRQRHSLPALRRTEKADQLAMELSQRLVTEKPLPPPKEELRTYEITYLKAPTLDIDDKNFKMTLNAQIIEVGIGVWFDKSKDYPGGAYFITILLYFSEK